MHSGCTEADSQVTAVHHAPGDYPSGKEGDGEADANTPLSSAASALDAPTADCYPAAHDASGH